MPLQLAQTSRGHLDRRLKPLRTRRSLELPNQGWIRAIRNALGLTAQQLAARLGVKQPTVTAIEQSELAGTISLNTLEKAARAMGCRVVYALVPERSLESTVRERALEVARKRLAKVNHTMSLEDQAVESAELKRQTAQLADYLMGHELSRIWREE
jgi:predicted DNA-binding mobile mystery protein A